MTVAALVVILLEGGLSLSLGRLRTVAAPVLCIGLAGTFLTAGGLALAAHVLLGAGWTLAGLLGAALAPTDPAVTFAVLGGRAIEGPSGTTLEGEAGINDPAGIALMLGIIELANHPHATVLVVGREFLVQMGVGAAFGVLGGRLLLAALSRAAPAGPTAAILVAFAGAGALYGVTALAHGSGFLAVFLFGLLLGDERGAARVAVERAGRHLAEVAEVAAFVALGATLPLGSMTGRDWLDGLVLLAVLAVVIRPLTVLLTLGPLPLACTERAFIAFSGLKGAVPILLAAFAITHGVADGQRIYHVVAIAVLGSVAVQGSLVPSVASRLGVPMR